MSNAAAVWSVVDLQNKSYLHKLFWKRAENTIINIHRQHFCIILPAQTEQILHAFVQVKPL